MDSVDVLARSLERLTAVMRHYAATPGGLSLTAAATLATLERFGPSRITHLATLEGVTQPAMTQLVTRLEGYGLVRRVADPDDGRVVLVEITDDGTARIAARRHERAERLSHALADLPDDQRRALADAVPALQSLAELVLPQHADA